MFLWLIYVAPWVMLLCLSLYTSITGILCIIYFNLFFDASCFRILFRDVLNVQRCIKITTKYNTLV